MLDKSEKIRFLERLRERITFSKPMKPEELESAFAQGMIRKLDLEDGAYYRGYCRNATVALWSASKSCFTYMRQKFDQRFPETICHPEDDNGFDLFIPLERATPQENEIVQDPQRRLG